MALTRTGELHERTPAHPHTPGRYRVTGPNGVRILGTLEVMSGTAGANTAEVDEQGHLIPEYDGDTEVSWDSQESDTDPGDYCLLWCAADGKTYHTCELTFERILEE